MISPVSPRFGTLYRLVQPNNGALDMDEYLDINPAVFLSTLFQQLIEQEEAHAPHWQAPLHYMPVSTNQTHIATAEDFIEIGKRYLAATGSAYTPTQFEADFSAEIITQQQSMRFANALNENRGLLKEIFKRYLKERQSAGQPVVILSFNQAGFSESAGLLN